VEVVAHHPDLVNQGTRTAAAVALTVLCSRPLKYTAG